MLKIIYLTLLYFILLPLVSKGQENINADQSEFLIDRSDLSQALNANSFQLQAGISYSQTELDDSSSKQFSIPSLIARYGISDYFTIQAKSEFDFNEYFINKNLVQKNSQVSYILIGLLYQIEQDKRILFFDQLSFPFDITIPFNSTYVFSSELDLILSTNISNRFSLEYGIGYLYQKTNGDDFNILFELEGYLTRNINCTISYNRSRIFELDSQSIQNLIGLELDFMTLSDYQIDICYTQGINEDYSFISGVFVYTFGNNN
jgi:hypothetical protein